MVEIIFGIIILCVLGLYYLQGREHARQIDNIIKAKLSRDVFEYTEAKKQEKIPVAQNEASDEILLDSLSGDDYDKAIGIK